MVSHEGLKLMGKIGSYARKNSLATALQEMGRIEKTIFILQYLSSEALRRKINRGLNKGEAMNALARAIFFGKFGELRERAKYHNKRNQHLELSIFKRRWSTAGRRETFRKSC